MGTCGWVEPEPNIMRTSANLVSDCMLMLLLDRKEAKGEACLLLYLLTAAGSNMSVRASLLLPNSIAAMLHHAWASCRSASGYGSFLELGMTQSM